MILCLISRLIVDSLTRWRLDCSLIRAPASFCPPGPLRRGRDGPKQAKSAQICPRYTPKVRPRVGVPLYPRTGRGIAISLPTLDGYEAKSTFGDNGDCRTFQLKAIIFIPTGKYCPRYTPLYLLSSPPRPKRGLFGLSGPLPKMRSGDKSRKRAHRSHRVRTTGIALKRAVTQCGVRSGDHANRRDRSRPYHVAGYRSAAISSKVNTSKPSKPDLSTSIAQLKSKWDQLSGVDRARALAGLRRKGGTIRGIAGKLGQSESNLRRLLKSLGASREDRDLARDGKILPTR